MTTTTVSQLESWDLPQVRGCVGRLELVAERLLPWQTRLDALGRQIGAAECWSGPAGTAAAAALVELSTVASGVRGALEGSLSSLQGLAGAAAEAHELAVAARAGAAAGGIGLDETGRPLGVPDLPHPAMAADQVAAVTTAREAAARAAAAAEEALAAARRALACATAAAEPLAGLGADGVASPADFADVTARLYPVRLPEVPGAADPAAVAAWWAGLGAAQQLAAIDSAAGVVGALDGLPAWARDRANRLNLAAASQHLPPGSDGHEVAEAVRAAIAGLEDDGAVAQLLLFDPAEGRVVLSTGDLDTAAAVGVLVPGVETTPADDLAGLVGDARDVAAAAGAAAPGLAVATVAWLGYRTPHWFTSVFPRASWRGGRDLDRALDGMAAARGGPGAPPPPRTTVVGHSYGTVVTGQAARAPGRLAADAVVLLGSPGTSAGRADRLEVEEVHGAWSLADPISTSGFYGPSPSSLGFGDEPLPTELTQGHTEYYDRDRPTLAAIGEVVAGTRGHR